MKILFASSSSIALPTLTTLYEHAFLRAVLTAPPAPSGRGQVLTPNPVDDLASRLGVMVLRPERLGSEARSMVSPLDCDLLVSFSYGRIFGPKFLSLFHLGGVNLHPSLLPRHRGPAPLVSTILSGDQRTGLTLQTLALEVDSGDILLQVEWELSPNDTTLSLSERTAWEAPALLLRALKNWEEVWSQRRPQDHQQATYSRLLQKSDGLIDWNNEALKLDRQIRACVPWPGSFTFVGERRLLIWEAQLDDSAPTMGECGQVLALDKMGGIRVQTGKGHLLLRTLQWEGKSRLDFRNFWNGNHVIQGKVLGKS